MFTRRRRRVPILRGVAYHIDEIAPIDRIPELAEDAELLAAFKESGHKTYGHSNQSLAAQAVSSTRKTLAAANLSVGDVEAIVLGTSEIPEPNRYPEMLSTEVLTALELSDVPVIGVTLAGCANYSSGLRVARDMASAEGLRHVLVIETNQVRGGMKRAVVDNGDAVSIFADGAATCAVSVEDDASFRGRSSDFELVAMAQTIKPLDWASAEENVIAANNFMGFRRVIDEAMERAGATRADFVQSFFSNIAIGLVNANAEVLGLPPVYTANNSRTAHVWSCDNLINLTDYCAAEQVPAGALFLLLSNAESYFSAIVCRKR